MDDQYELFEPTTELNGHTGLGLVWMTVIGTVRAKTAGESLPQSLTVTQG